MKFSFENQGVNTYLVCEIAPDDVVDTMSMGMITNNKIPGLAPSIFSQMDDIRYMKYNVSAKTSVSQFFAGEVNKKRLISVLTGIINTVLVSEDYMIDVKTLLIDLDYIFVDVSTCETMLVCLPIMNREKTVTDFGAFFRNLVFSVRFDQRENCDYVARLINYLNRPTGFSLLDFKALLTELGAEGTARPVMQPVPQPPVQQAAPVQQPMPQVQPVPAKQVQQQPAPQVKKQPAPQKPVPQQSVKSTAPVQPQAQTEEKKVSFMTLMMHYNKENKELYKAQKEAKKLAKENGQQALVQPQSAVAKAPANVGFAIPGQPAQSVPQTAAKPQAPIPARPAAPAQPQMPQQPKTPVQQPMPQQPKAPVQQPIPQQPVYQAPVRQPNPQQAPAAVQPVAPQPISSANFGETTILGGGSAVSGETTVLNAGTVAPKPYLLRMKNNERIMVDKPVFRIGKERSYVDYFIADNTAISRSHANIVSRDGEYFIVDTNSTNHTYVNGTMIRSNTETKLAHGTKIMLANESFEFMLY